MGEIKSALEIALEKTAHIKGDISSIQNREFRNDGKRLANHYLDTGDSGQLTDAVEATEEEHRKSTRDGAVSILLAAIKLPVEETDIEKTMRIGDGLEALLPGKGVAEMFSQVEQIFRQYLTEWGQTQKALEQQFMPKIRAKQQELSRRYGQPVPMELHQDPEYIAAFSRAKHALEEKYDMVIDEIRSRIQEISGTEEA